MKKTALLYALALGIAGTACAADSGFYVGGSLGDGKLGVNSTVGLSKNSDVVYGGILGYQFNPNFATEVQYSGAGKATDVNGNTLKADALSVSALGILPLSNGFGIYGKLGLASTKTSTTGTFSGTGTGASRTAVTYGLGGQYDINPAITIRLGWDRYGADSSTQGVSNNFNADVYSIGAVYHFF